MKSKELAKQALFEVRDHVLRNGMDFIASAHDEESVNFLSELGVAAIKIGSGEMLNTPLLKKASSKGLPVIYSTGMQTLDDVALACATFKAQEADFALLHCVTLYPTRPDEVNLKAIHTLKNKFRVPVGYSDHTSDSLAVFTAVSTGAQIIEKHIALERNVPNTQDPAVSCVGTEELSAMVEGVRRVEAMMGTGRKQPADRERQSIAWARKSIVARTKLSAGSIITQDVLTTKRPGTGLAANQIHKLVGKQLLSDVDADEMLTEEMVVERNLKPSTIAS
jgi:sialic acid synthase SpsE